MNWLCLFGRHRPHVAIWYRVRRQWWAYTVCKRCRGDRVDYNLLEHLPLPSYAWPDNFEQLTSPWLRHAQTPSKNE